VYRPVFAAATIAITLLAIVVLLRGLRARTRAGCGSYAVWCLLLAIIQGGVTVACRVAGLAGAFAGVAGVDPSEKARLLSEHIGNVAEIGLFGVTASLPPVVYAAVLFVRGRRLPVARSD
jgi:hypothetical protein